MKIQFSYQKKPLILMKHQKFLLKGSTHNQAMMGKIELMISSKNLQSFKDFQSSVENKLMKMEEAITSNCRCHSQTQRIGDEGDAT